MFMFFAESAPGSEAESVELVSVKTAKAVKSVLGISLKRGSRVSKISVHGQSESDVHSHGTREASPSSDVHGDDKESEPLNQQNIQQQQLRQAQIQQMLQQQQLMQEQLLQLQQIQQNQNNQQNQQQSLNFGQCFMTQLFYYGICKKQYCCCVLSAAFANLHATCIILCCFSFRFIGSIQTLDTVNDFGQSFRMPLAASSPAMGKQNIQFILLRNL